MIPQNYCKYCLFMGKTTVERNRTECKPKDSSGKGRIMRFEYSEQYCHLIIRSGESILTFMEKYCRL